MDMNDKPQQTAQLPAKRDLPTVIDNGEFGMLMDTQKFAQLQRIGTMYARSKMVPAHFQGDEPSCMVAVQMAMRLQIDPFMFLQKTYVVGGKPGMEAPLVIALVNTRGPFKGPINWDVKRDERGDVIECTAYATHRDTGQVCSSTVTWKMVEAEGWSKKSGSKWLTLREQMFKYRSATFLARLYCPEVIMGMSTADELQEIDVTPPTPERVSGDAPAPRRGLKDRVIDAPTGDEHKYVPPDEKVTPRDPIDQSAALAGRTPTTEELIDSGHIVVHDDPTAAQGGAGATEAAEVAPTPQVASPGAPAAPTKPPGIPYESTLALAKKAKTQSQVDIVRDAMRDAGYTAEQEDNIKAILNSKKLAEE